MTQDLLTALLIRQREEIVIQNVTIEADAEVIEGIESGDVKVFAVLRLASSDMEQQITAKPVTTFLAIMEDGTGSQVVASVEDPSTLNIELAIKSVALQTQ